MVGLGRRRYHQQNILCHLSSHIDPLLLRLLWLAGLPRKLGVRLAEGTTRITVYPLVLGAGDGEGALVDDGVDYGEEQEQEREKGAGGGFVAVAVGLLFQFGRLLSFDHDEV